VKHRIVCLGLALDEPQHLVSLWDQMAQQPAPAPHLPKRPSLAQLAAQSLREGIASGLWQGHLPGERELSEALQISRRTLRAALEELERQGLIEVHERRQRRIVATQATHPTGKRKRIIAVLSPTSHFSMPWPMTFVLDTLRSRLGAAGFEVQFHVQPACYVRSPGKVLSRFFAAHPAAAWLVCGAQVPLQRWLATQNLPFLLLGSSAPGIPLPSVDNDYRALCYHAGCTLWRKGHRRIALVLNRGEYGGDIASEEGLREALQAMPGTDLRVLRHSGNTSSLCAALDESLRSAHPPTAYIVARSAHVLTVMMHLMLRGRRIPRDVAILARDHDPILEATSPTVARYRTEPKRLASRIAQALQQLAQSGVMDQPHIRLTPEFVAGDSI